VFRATTIQTPVGRVVGVAALLALLLGLAGCRHRASGQRDTTPTTSHAAQAPPAAVAAPPAPGPVSFTLAATGDLLLHEPVTRRAQALAGGRGYDFRPLLAHVRPILSAADLAICHMETPLSRDDRRISYWPSFNAPHEIASAVRWAGYDTCTTASNHTLDRGGDGVRATLDALDAARLEHVGTARSPAERSWRTYRVRGVRVAHLDYTYGLNGISLPQGMPWLVNLINPRRILADAHAARQAGAQFVLGPDPARRPAARRALHPHAAGAHRPRRARNGPPGHPPDAAGRRPSRLRPVQEQEGRPRPRGLPAHCLSCWPARAPGVRAFRMGQRPASWSLLRNGHRRDRGRRRLPRS